MFAKSLCGQWNGSEWPGNHETHLSEESLTKYLYFSEVYLVHLDARWPQGNLQANLHCIIRGHGAMFTAVSQSA